MLTHPGAVQRGDSPGGQRGLPSSAPFQAPGRRPHPGSGEPPV